MYKRKNIPPKLAGWLLKQLLTKKNRDSIIGDFEEIYNEVQLNKGALLAFFWYWFQVLKSFPSVIINSLEWGLDMLKNYFKIAARNLWRNKIYAFINILGLGLALTNAIVGYLNYDYSKNFDNFHENGDNIFRVIGVRPSGENNLRLGMVPIPLGSSIKENLAGVDKAVSLEWATAAVRFEDKLFNEQILYADDGFLDMFSFPLISGTIDLRTNSEIVISDEYAQKYFGRNNPIGETVTISYSNGIRQDLVVSGIIKKNPFNSSIRFDLLTSSQLLVDAGLNEKDNWNFVSHALFIQVENPDGAESIRSQIKNYLPPLISETGNPLYTDFLLDPLDEIAANSRNTQNNNLVQTMPLNNIIAMIVSGLLILLAACFNYINTSLAFASKRLKEIGVRKTLGSSRSNLITQHMSENILLTFIALIFAMLFSYAYALPWYNDLSGGEVLLTFSPFENFRLLLFLIALLITTGIISGFYPAYIVSKFNPIGIFRGKQKPKKVTLLIRTLLTVQFSFALIAIIGSIVFSQNAEYNENFDLGYEKNLVLNIPIQNEPNFELFKDKIRNDPRIASISGSRHQIFSGGSRQIVQCASTEKEITIFNVGFNYLETVQLRLNSGRSFDENIVTDKENSVIVNQNFINQFGWDNAIEKTITLDSQTYQVIGTIQDFWIHGTFSPSIPALLRISDPETYTMMQVRILPNNVKSTYEYLESEWKALFPYTPFEGYYHNRALAAALTLNKSIERWAIAIAFIAIIIAAMGLFSMVSLKIVGLTKEIGIRKVLGATNTHILTLINKEFLILILVSMVLGNTAGYFLMQLLLNSIYAYHVTFGIVGLLIADITILIVAVVTVAYHLRKAANTNPVDSLRYE